MNTRILPGFFLLCILNACASPKTEPVPPQAIVPTNKNPENSQLSHSSWDGAKKPNLPSYPALARLAGIQGMVIMDLEIDPSGKVQKVTRVSGPPQLCSTVDGFARKILFQPAGEGLTTPSSFRLHMRFDLPGQIGAGPSPESIVLQKVPTPPPSF
jgi:TonB family protein